MSRWWIRGALVGAAVLTAAFHPAMAFDFDTVLKKSAETGKKGPVGVETEGVQGQSNRMQNSFIQQDLDKLSVGNDSGSLNCAMVVDNPALWRYCTAGDCSGFAENYGLYRLCEDNDPGGLSQNYAVYSYLTDGNPYVFKDYFISSGAKDASGSFADRKRFVIFMLNGYPYRDGYFR